MMGLEPRKINKERKTKIKKQIKKLKFLIFKK